MNKADKNPVNTPSDGFPIVGIGASAGGLEALELFLEHTPPATGMAFIIVSHLDPDHKCIIVELLQHKTTMPVVQIADQMVVEPDHVYVMPPQQDISILHRILYLLEPSAKRGLRLPIDFFLHSLAEDQRQLCVGVILSGMGADGSSALSTIKEKGGAVFVQDPASAKFNGMPDKAIATGLVDVVAPVEELPNRIISYLHNAPPLIVAPADAVASPEPGGLAKIVVLLRTHTGHDF